ncbi:MAG: DinB family protein [Anaerolineae bacterium]|nr:DinB family protein [Anaerolineae bacterium]
MRVDELQYLLDYHVWANEQVLQAARRLSAEQLHNTNNISIGSAFHLLVHMMSAQNTWLMRWQGLTPPGHVSPQDYADLDQLKQAWDDLNRQYSTFLAGLDEQRLNAAFAYKTFKGESHSDPLGWVILHVFNHSTEHRSQVVAICNMAGIDTGALDLIHYMRTVARPKG